ncbi:MAG: single-stranded DNA-binding protein [Deltaproteobacteria bacterium]|nr:single-stranded DNA-binding protein [Deltaproteobacteria bacterium]
MGNLNKVLLIGHLGQDPEKRVTQSGSSVVTINLATTEKFTDRSGAKQEKTEWHRVVFWNKQAELIEQYCKKGSQLYIEGSLQTREWTDKEGNKRWTTEIAGRNMQFLDSKQGGYSQEQRAPQQGSQQGSHGFQGQGSGYHDNQPPPPNNDFIDDDIPF